MSGKEPPKGPRALRASGPFGSSVGGGPSSQQPTASTSRQTGASLGSGLAPPTGPRSLNGMVGGRGGPPPAGPSKAYVNLNGLSRQPPSGPKGKGAAALPQQPTTPTSWPNGKVPPAGPSALRSDQKLVNGTGSSMVGSSPTTTRRPISFSLSKAPSTSTPIPPKQSPPPVPSGPPPPPPPGPSKSPERPPSPLSSPPPPPPSHPPNGHAHPQTSHTSSPPPPPSIPPPPRSPPPPPPAEIPQNRSPLSIKLPVAQPQEPRLAPPPLPPAPLEGPESSKQAAEKEREKERKQEWERERDRRKGPEPQPPSSAPPPLPPADPRRLNSVPKPPPPPARARSRSPSLHSSKRYDSPVRTRRGAPSPSSVRSSSRRSPSPPPRVAPPREPTPPLPDGVAISYRRIPGTPYPQRLYTLKPPPMPLRSSYNTDHDRDYKVLFDSSCDKDKFGEMHTLMNAIRAAGKENERIKDQGKGKVIVYRYQGEVVPGEVRDERGLRVCDPRRGTEYKPPKARTEFYPASYEYDGNSPGPPPATNILIFGFSELTPTMKIRQHFSKYGTIVSADRQMDPSTGGQMGIATISYSIHEEAKRAVEGEEGKNFSLAAIGGGPTVSFAGAAKGGKDKDSVKIVFDQDGKLLKLVVGLYEEKKRLEKEKGRKQAFGQAGESPSVGGSTAGTPAATAQLTPGQQQYPNSLPRRPFPHPPQAQQQQSHHQQPYPNQYPRPRHGLPPHPNSHVAPNLPPRVGPSHLSRGSGFQQPGGRYETGVSATPMRAPSGPSGRLMAQDMRRQLPPSLVRARPMNAVRSIVPQNMPSNLHTPVTESDSRPLTPVSAVRGRGGVRKLSSNLAHRRAYTPSHASSSTPRGSRSPSPTAIASRRPDSKQSQAEREAKHRSVMQALSENGFEYARIDAAQLSGSAVREEDVRDFFKRFDVKEVFHDHVGWYITFQKPDAAARAGRVLALGTHTLANRSVSVTVHPAPRADDVRTLSPSSHGKTAEERRVWKPQEMLEEAGKTVLTELRALLEKDVMERIVSAQIRKMIAEDREKRGKEDEAGKTRHALEDLRLVDKAKGDGDRERERQRLKGLSFKKRKQKTDAEAEVVPTSQRELMADVDKEHEHEGVSLVVTQAEEEEPLVAVTLLEETEEDSTRRPEKEERPRKRRKKAELKPKVVVREREVESEDEEPELQVEVIPSRDEEIPAVELQEPESAADISPVHLKRSLSPTVDDALPAKRPKVVENHVDEQVDIETLVVTAAPAKRKKSTKKGKAEKIEKKPAKRSKKSKADRAVLETLVIPPQVEVEAPSVEEVRVSPSSAWESVLSPVPPRPAATEKQLLSPKRYSPLPESILRELIEDDEDLYLAKVALSVDVDEEDFMIDKEITPPSDPGALPPSRRHVTGSARSEGYYKIPHAEKSAYVAQYASRAASSGVTVAKETVAAPQQPVMSSRSNRANARRRAQGLEEMNQLQLAVALSKGENAATEVMKFNQLQTRKKHLRFARSPIHDWGLYAMERISRGEMVIEYVGEVIRAAVADKREKAYERQGIGSSYLFRIDEDLVVDATKKGNLGRLINHSCDPNCTAKIITINGEKKIVIYAKQDIELGDEITYDYHFPIEQDKIPCLCGSAKCRGFLN